MSTTNLAIYLWSIVAILYSGELLFHYYFWQKSSYRHQSQASFWTIHGHTLIQVLPDALKHIVSKITKNNWLYGEYQIYRTLEKIPWYGKILTNVYIPQWVNIDKTEIDILFLHQTGIYCIESKDWCGSVYWSEDTPSWTQYISWKQYTQHNPTRQNYWHIKSLEKLIPTLQNNIQSIIVFSDHSKIKVHTPHNIVIQLRDLKKIIQTYPGTTLSAEDIEKGFTYLSRYTHISNQEKRHHIEQVQALQQKSPTLL